MQLSGVRQSKGSAGTGVPVEIDTARANMSVASRLSARSCTAAQRQYWPRRLRLWSICFRSSRSLDPSVARRALSAGRS